MEKLQKTMSVDMMLDLGRIDWEERLVHAAAFGEALDRVKHVGVCGMCIPLSPWALAITS